MTSDAKRIPFTEEDERKIGSAAIWGMIVSITSVITGTLTLLAELAIARASLSLLLPILATAFGVLINVWLLQASLALRKVATSDVADQAHLLSGFRRLRTYFMGQVMLVFLTFGMALLGGVLNAL